MSCLQQKASEMKIRVRLLHPTMGYSWRTIVELNC